jgi:orotidine-5'-phosphate decarboxylase
MKNYNPIIFAIDTNNFEYALSLLKETEGLIGLAKFGLEFFYHFGIDGLKKINSIFPNLKIFLDLKFYDIPNTVSKSLYSFSQIKNIEMMTFHSQGGSLMINEANKILNQILFDVKLLAVTKLTSFEINEDEILELGKGAVINGGASGLIAPAKISRKLKNEIQKDFLIVSPGIRFSEDAIIKDDQRAVMSPKEALESGSDYLVIGRPILESENKKQFLKRILESI